MASFAGASRIPLSQLAALYRTCPTGNSSCWEPPTARTTASRAPSADQVVPYMFVATLITIVVFLVLGLAAGAIVGVGGYAGV